MAVTGQELYSSSDDMDELESSEFSGDFEDKLYSETVELERENDDDPSDDTLPNSADSGDGVVGLDNDEVDDPEPSSDENTRHLRGYSRQLYSYNPAEDGMNDGMSRLDQEWINIGNGCANAFKIRKVGEDLIDKYYTSSPWDNWRRKAYLKGSANGVMRRVRYYERECLGGGENGIDECNGLGEAAATLIAQDLCSTHRYYRRFHSRRRSWRRMCLSAGVDICKGNVYSKVNKLCGAKIGTGTYARLQKKCRPKVKSLVN